MNNGAEPFTDDYEKECCCHQYFKSVFAMHLTHEYRDMDVYVQGSMPELNITYNGVLNFFNNIRVSSASGPYNVPCHFFKVCVESIAHSLVILYSKSLEAGLMPQNGKMLTYCPLIRVVLKQ